MNQKRIAFLREKNRCRAFPQKTCCRENTSFPFLSEWAYCPAALPPGLSFKSDRFCRRQNRAWSEIKFCFRKTADMRRRFARSWLCGEQSHGRKRVNQKAEPFERGKTLQNFAERQSEQRLSPQVRPKFRKAEFCVWPENFKTFPRTQGRTWPPL